MTDLIKPVRRRLLSTDRKGRRFAATLEPGDIITFQPKGSRRKISVHLGFCIQLAQAYTIQREYDEKMATYQARKKAGARGIRKPKKPFAPFGTIILNTLKTNLK